MDGRLFTVLAFLVVPAIVIGATVAFFSSNPVTIVAAMAVMIVGAFYLLTYRETFA